jgi:hypothetical protein
MVKVPLQNYQEVERKRNASSWDAKNWRWGKLCFVRYTAGNANTKVAPANQKGKIPNTVYHTAGFAELKFAEFLAAQTKFINNLLDAALAKRTIIGRFVETRRVVRRLRSQEGL